MKQPAYSEMITARTTDLEKTLNIPLSNIPSGLHTRLFGDFLVRKKPKKMITTIAREYKVYMTLSEDMQRLIQKNPKSGVLTVACNHSGPSLPQFLLNILHTQIRRRGHLHIIFSHFWKEIFGHIKKCNRDGWEQRIRNAMKIFSTSIPHLSVEMLMGGTAYVARAILRTKGITASDDKFITRACSFSNHPSYDNVDGIVDWVISHKKKSSKVRRKELTNMLSKNGCKLRSDSHFCRNWIEGTILCDVEEVVGVVLITRALFDISHITWSRKHHSIEESLLELVKNDGFAKESWIKNAKKMIEDPDFAHSEDDEEEDYDSAAFDSYDDYSDDD